MFKKDKNLTKNVYDLSKTQESLSLEKLKKQEENVAISKNQLLTKNPDDKDEDFKQISWSAPTGMRENKIIEQFNDPQDLELLDETPEKQNELEISSEAQMSSQQYQGSQDKAPQAYGSEKNQQDISSQHHVYSALSIDQNNYKTSYKFTEKLRHPFKYLRHVIQESTAPNIPLEDIIANEQIHNKIEQTDVYRERQIQEQMAQDYKTQMLHYIKDKAVNTATYNIKEEIETVKEGAEKFYEKAKDFVGDEAHTIKDKTGQLVQNVSNKLTSDTPGQSNIGKAVETSQDLARKTIDKADSFYQAGKEQFEPYAQKIKNKVEPYIEEVQETVKPYYEKAKEEVQPVITKVRDTVRDTLNPTSNEADKFADNYGGQEGDIDIEDKVQRYYQKIKPQQFQGTQQQLQEEQNMIREMIRQELWRHLEQQQPPAQKDKENLMRGQMDQQQWEQYQQKQQRPEVRDINKQQQQSYQSQNLYPLEYEEYREEIEGDYIDKANEYIQPKVQGAKEKIQPQLQQAKEKIQPKLQQAKETLEPKLQQAKEKIEPKLQQAKEKIEPKLQQAKEKIEPKLQQVKEKIEPKMQQAKDKIQPVIDSAKEKAQSFQDNSKQTVPNLSQKAKETVQSKKEQANQAKEQIKYSAQQTAEQANGKVQEIQEKAQQIAERTKDSANEVKGQAKEKGQAYIQEAKDRARRYQESIGRNQVQYQQHQGSARDLQSSNLDLENQISQPTYIQNVQNSQSQQWKDKRTFDEKDQDSKKIDEFIKANSSNPQLSTTSNFMGPSREYSVEEFESNLTLPDIYTLPPKQQQRYGVEKQQVDILRDQKLTDQYEVERSVNQNKDSLRSNIRTEIKLPENVKESQSSQAYAAPYPEESVNPQFYKESISEKQDDLRREQAK
ncbi:UNKNOWN [Stylonychia lemnae]|uniref:Uncharacterized protein n=1 Tax=Stylonychia lemnae TaxID=5949 RepID=A0A078AHF3_STYLE|nr:UNKNOWN [Stylonychia lemnae]|eukprot:CDW80268.1 UNKNOWN [Stylonychia lemnae]